MTPADYYDWWFFSGICPGVPTRPANYSNLCDRVSAAGVHLIVLWELLRENAQSDETSYIRPTSIAGSHNRIEAAARDAGAAGLVAYWSDSAVVPETHRELKKLLKHYVAKHKAELAADIVRHGDPRAMPGFDKKQARRKREEQWVENEIRFQIDDQIPFFVEPMNILRTFLAQGMTLAEIALQNDQMADLACCIQYDFPRWSESPQPPEVARFQEECRRLTEQYPAQLPAWGGTMKALLEKYAIPSQPEVEVSADQNILNQLQAIGSYKAERFGQATVISWSSLPSLKNDLGPVGLRFMYEGACPPELLMAWPDV